MHMTSWGSCIRMEMMIMSCDIAVSLLHLEERGGGESARSKVSLNVSAWFTHTDVSLKKRFSASQTACKSQNKQELVFLFRKKTNYHLIINRELSLVVQCLCLHTVHVTLLLSCTSSLPAPHPTAVKQALTPVSGEVTGCDLNSEEIKPRVLTRRQRTGWQPQIHGCHSPRQSSPTCHQLLSGGTLFVFPLRILAGVRATQTSARRRREDAWQTRRAITMPVEKNEVPRRRRRLQWNTS